jgi:hypothetical protein
LVLFGSLPVVLCCWVLWGLSSSILFFVFHHSFDT